jgi:hypothetical protein
MSYTYSYFDQSQHEHLVIEYIDILQRHTDIYKCVVAQNNTTIFKYFANIKEFQNEIVNGNIQYITNNKTSDDTIMSIIKKKKIFQRKKLYLSFINQPELSLIMDYVPVANYCETKNNEMNELKEHYKIHKKHNPEPVYKYNEIPLPSESKSKLELKIEISNLKKNICRIKEDLDRQKKLNIINLEYNETLKNDNKKLMVTDLQNKRKIYQLSNN